MTPFLFGFLFMHNYHTLLEMLMLWCHVSWEHIVELMQFFQNHHRIRNKVMISQLQADLVEYLWQQRGASRNI